MPKCRSRSQHLSANTRSPFKRHSNSLFSAFASASFSSGVAFGASLKTFDAIGSLAEDSAFCKERRC